MFAERISEPAHALNVMYARGIMKKVLLHPAPNQDVHMIHSWLKCGNMRITWIIILLARHPGTAWLKSRVLFMFDCRTKARRLGTALLYYIFLECFPFDTDCWISNFYWSFKKQMHLMRKLPFACKMLIFVENWHAAKIRTAMGRKEKKSLILWSWHLCFSCFSGGTRGIPGILRWAGRGTSGRTSRHWQLQQRLVRVVKHAGASREFHGASRLFLFATLVMVFMDKRNWKYGPA